MDFSLVFGVLLASVLAQAAGQGTGDCCKRMIYNDISTNGAEREKTKYTSVECDQKCNEDPMCKSYHFDYVNDYACWMQTMESRAYNHLDKVGLRQVELPCRIPDQGCEYMVYAEKDDNKAKFKTYAGGSNPLQCHAWCVDNRAVCNAWRWDVSAPQDKRCQYTDSLNAPTDFEGKPGVFLFELKCSDE